MPISGAPEKNDFGVNRNGIIHNGIDIVAKQGVNIVAPEDLQVVDFNTVYVPNTYPSKISNGNYLKAMSLDKDRRYIFLHLQDVVNFKINDIIKKGEIVGIVGNTGYSTTPHLHLSVEDVNNKYTKISHYGKYVSFYDLKNVYFS